MKAIVAGLGLSLLAGSALAQSAPNPPMPGVVSPPGAAQAQTSPGQPDDGGAGKHGLTPEGGPPPSGAAGMAGDGADPKTTRG